MICRVCGSDNLKVIKSPHKTDKYDTRQVQCQECNSTFITKTTMLAMFYAGAKADIVELEKRGVIKELSSKFMKIRQSKIDELGYKDELF